MESLQITLNSRTSTVLDTQKRSVMTVSLNKDAIPIPKDKECTISVISAEILNNFYSIDAYTFQSYYAYKTSFLVTSVGNASFTMGASDYTALQALAPANSKIMFIGNIALASNGLLANGIQYYIKAYSPNYINVTLTPGGVNVAGLNTAYDGTSPVSIVPIPYSTTLNIPAGNYTPTTLATAITTNNASIASSNFGGTGKGKITCTNSSNNILSLTCSNVGLYFTQTIPAIGLTQKVIASAGGTVVCASTPFLQQKYLQISSSFVTSRNQPLCKIPVNAAFGSYILYNPQILFPVKIYNDLINTFQISLLDENGQPINNNYADWSVTLQFDFKDKKSAISIATLHQNE